MLPWLDAITGLLAGGKRLRPAFCYWGWRGSGRRGRPGDSWPQRPRSSCCTRARSCTTTSWTPATPARGQPSVHRRFAARHASGGWRGSAESFGTGTAILVGDLLLTWTDQLFHASGLPPAALARGQQVLDAMRVEVISGQYLDLLGQAAGDGTVASALRVVRYKSAKYTIERPLHLGAALAGPPGCGGQPVTAAFTRYGIPLGIAFQLRDDLLGVFGNPAQTGKPASDDLREGKRTVLVAIATGPGQPGPARGARPAARRPAAHRGRRRPDPRDPHRHRGGERVRADDRCQRGGGAVRARGRAHHQPGPGRAGRAGRHRDGAQRLIRVRRRAPGPAGSPRCSGAP